MDQGTVIETENVTRESRGKSASVEGQLRAVSRESHALQVQTRGKPFTVGNRANLLRGRKPKSLPEELDAIAKELVRRLRSRNPKHSISPPAANAVCALLHLRLQLYQQFEAAEESARLYEQLAFLEAKYAMLRERGAIP